MNWTSLQSGQDFVTMEKTVLQFECFGFDKEVTDIFELAFRTLDWRQVRGEATTIGVSGIGEEIILVGDPIEFSKVDEPEGLPGKDSQISGLEGAQNRFWILNFADTHHRNQALPKPLGWGQWSPPKELGMVYPDIFSPVLIFDEDGSKGVSNVVGWQGPRVTGRETRHIAFGFANKAIGRKGAADVLPRGTRPKTGLD